MNQSLIQRLTVSLSRPDDYRFLLVMLYSMLGLLTVVIIELLRRRKYPGKEGWLERSLPILLLLLILLLTDRTITI